MPPKVNVEDRAGGAYVLLQPEGAIDATTYTLLGGEVEAILKRATVPTLIIFNLDRVGFVSSAGIGVVLAAEKSMKAKGGKALLVNLKPHVRKVFDIVQALPAQQIYNSVGELDAYLAEMQRQVREGPPG